MGPRRQVSRHKEITLLEKNVYRKKVSRSTVRIAIAYPSTYQVAHSSLSVHLLYNMLNQYDDVYAERVVMEGEGPYRSIETGTPLREFDIVMFSVHYELDYVNIVRMLLESGIPARREERACGKYPIIVVGGPTVSANPEPLADIADILIIGEAEPVVEKLIDEISYILDRRFDAVASGYGIYVPSLGKYEVHYTYTRDLDSAFYPTKQIIVLEAPEGYTPVFGKAFLLEVVRGCPYMCKFCMEAYVQFPFRIRSYSTLLDILKKGLEHCPVSKVVLIGLGTQSHPEIKRLARYLLEKNIEVSFPSLRADKLDDEFLRLLAESGQDVLTIAPESSERLRYAVGKYFTDRELLDLCKRALESGLKHVKLYFIVGLPGEHEGDIKECVKLIQKVCEAVKGRVYLSVNPWIRKPHTPLQYFQPYDIELVNRRVKMLVSELSLRHTLYDPVLAYGQMLLSLGDREVSKIILELAVEKANPLARSTWRRVLREYSDLVKRYIFRSYSPSEELPWSHVKLGLSERTLIRKAEEYADMAGAKFTR